MRGRLQPTPPPEPAFLELISGPASPRTVPHAFQMDGPTRTSRQQIMDLITGAPYSSRELAHALRMAEREIEGHLEHIARSIGRDPGRRFVLEPAACEHCGFVFRDRRRLTRPSRCPRCQSERVSAPRYEIQLQRRA